MLTSEDWRPSYALSLSFRPIAEEKMRVFNTPSGLPQSQLAERAGASLLEVRELSKVFGSTRALDAVTLDVKFGEIHALLGENGAGKSTLIKIIAGVQPPTAGTILLAGAPFVAGSPQEAEARGIAVVHQHSTLVSSLSVEENLWLGRPLPARGGIFVDWSRVRRHARDVLDYVGSTVDPGALVQTLRPDERAMISIAKAIASDARLVILDEPTATLMPHECATLFSQMRRLAREGHGFLYVSHRLAEVMDVCDGATVLRDGRNVGTFSRETLNRGAVVNAIVGPGKSMRAVSDVAGNAGNVTLTVSDLSGHRISGVSFSARQGEILGLAGLPGSGAEETLDVLFGRTARSSGSIVLDGRALRLHDTRDAIAAGIALLPKDRLLEAVISGHNVRENMTIVTLGRYRREPLFRFIDRRKESAGATKTAASLNIKMRGLEAPVETLSGGNQQKAMLGRWLDSGAKLFLLSSPTAAVDVGAKGEIYALIRSLAANGATIVFTSTEVEEFARVCSRVVVFREGRIERELLEHDLTEANIMNAAVGTGLGAAS